MYVKKQSNKDPQCLPIGESLFADRVKEKYWQTIVDLFWGYCSRLCQRLAVCLGTGYLTSLRLSRVIKTKWYVACKAHGNLFGTL